MCGYGIKKQKTSVLDIIERLLSRSTLHNCFVICLYVMVIMVKAGEIEYIDQPKLVFISYSVFTQPTKLRLIIKRHRVILLWNI
jgi:hypothetical protein